MNHAARAAGAGTDAVVPDRRRWPDAALVGCASAMRTFAGPALLGARGRVASPWHYALWICAAGELLVDKASFATDRTDPPALAGRIAAGALSGREIAGLPGLPAGAMSAAAGTFATYRARKLVVSRTGLPDRVVAVVEDLLAYGLAAWATRSLAGRG